MSDRITQTAQRDDGAPVIAKLSTLDRFLPVWIIAAMALGLVLGRLIPSQEVCEALYASLDRHKGSDASFPAFAFGIAANKVAMHHRGRSRHREQIVDTPPDRADRAPSPEDHAVAAETSTYLTGLLSRLPDKTRQILMLRIAAGLSADETAEVLHMSPGAVRVAQHRALHQLRALAELELQS